MILRPEQEHDFSAIREINIRAFASCPYSYQAEHLIVESLRTAGTLALSWVAEIDGQVVGHIAHSAVTIGGKDQHWHTLGPVAV